MRWKYFVFTITNCCTGKHSADRDPLAKILTSTTIVLCCNFINFCEFCTFSCTVNLLMLLFALPWSRSMEHNMMADLLGEVFSPLVSLNLLYVTCDQRTFYFISFSSLLGRVIFFLGGGGGEEGGIFHFPNPSMYDTWMDSPRVDGEEVNGHR